MNTPHPARDNLARRMFRESRSSGVPPYWPSLRTSPPPSIRGNTSKINSAIYWTATFTVLLVAPFTLTIRSAAPEGTSAGTVKFIW